MLRDAREDNDDNIFERWKGWLNVFGHERLWTALPVKDVQRKQAKGLDGVARLRLNTVRPSAW